MKGIRMLALLPLAALLGACSEDHVTGVESRNIVEVAADVGTFTTLIAALEAADLAEVLQGEGPFTVFAPTDAAFAQLPAGTVEGLLADPQALATILTYHVVPGRLTSAQIVASGGGQATTVQGQTLTIQLVGGSVRVEGATVTAADVAASNGVIHVIDRVLLPD